MARLPRDGDVFLLAPEAIGRGTEWERLFRVYDPLLPTPWAQKHRHDGTTMGLKVSGAGGWFTVNLKKHALCQCHQERGLWRKANGTAIKGQPEPETQGTLF